MKVVDRSFPGLQGWSENFTIKEEWYSLKNLSKDIHVLLVLETEGMYDFDYRRPPYPIAWARLEGKGQWDIGTTCGRASASSRCSPER